MRKRSAFVPMRMNKNGDVTIGSYSSATKITAWVADSGSPGTAISNDSLVVNGAKSTATIFLRGAIYSSSAARNVTLYIYLNGTSIASNTFSIPLGSTPNNYDLTASNVNLKNNDVVAIYARTDNTGGNTVFTSSSYATTS